MVYNLPAEMFFPQEDAEGWLPAAQVIDNHSGGQ